MLPQQIMVFFATLLCFITVELLGADYLKGTYDTDKHLMVTKSPYFVTEDIVIGSSASLIIQNGVKIDFMGNYKMEVYGSIISGCNSMNTSISTNRGLWNISNYIHIRGGDKIKIYDGGFGQFCNTKFEDMIFGIMADGEPQNDNKYIIDNCEFIEIQKALHFTLNQKYMVSDSIFIDISNYISYNGGVLFNNCKFDKYNELFSNTAIDATIKNSALLNGAGVCLEILATATNGIYNNIIRNCGKSGIIVISTGIEDIFYISNNNISECKGYGIQTTHGETFILNNIFNNNSKGIYTEGNYLQIINNTFSYIVGDVIYTKFIFGEYGIINGNIFEHNGRYQCNHLIYAENQGMEYFIENNTFINNTCNHTLIYILNMDAVEILHNKFIDNVVSKGAKFIYVYGDVMEMRYNLFYGNMIIKDMNGGLIWHDGGILVHIEYNNFSHNAMFEGSSQSKLVYIGTSDINTNLTIHHNAFDSNINSDIVYLDGYYTINIKENRFIMLLNNISSYIYIKNSKSDDMRIERNDFYTAQNIDNFIKLDNTMYDVKAMNNYFDGIQDINKIATKMHDFCDDDMLGHIEFCPWFRNNIVFNDNYDQINQCNCYSMDLCMMNNSIICNPININISYSTISPTVSTKATILYTTEHPIISTKEDKYDIIFSVVFKYGYIADIDRDIMSTIIEEMMYNIMNNTITDKKCMIFNNMTIQNGDEWTFNGSLSVCNEQSELQLLRLFNDDIMRFDIRLQSEIKNRINLSVSDVFITIIIGDDIFIYGDNIITTTEVILSLHPINENRRYNNFIYIFIFVVIIIFFCIVGMIQYCKYEGKAIQKAGSIQRLPTHTIDIVEQRISDTPQTTQTIQTSVYPDDFEMATDSELDEFENETLNEEKMFIMTNGDGYNLSDHSDIH